jgi:acetyltransferase
MRIAGSRGCDDRPMTIRNLGRAFRPRSVAIIGASTREGSVGRIVLRNVVHGGFAGPVWPVNPKARTIDGITCFARVADLPDAPDLAVIVAPPTTIPGLIGELGAKGTRTVIVITAGLTKANGLRQAMLDAAKPYLLRIIGPNTLGMMVPPVALDASFSHHAPAKGTLALLSQSGAIVTSLVDWAAARGIGFSHVVSMGDMADVDTGDGLDWLASDLDARAVLMYLETITEPRKFLSAARAASRVKPVVAIKSGRHAQAAQAAATHTGALAGSDRVADAALRRCGVLRVHDLDDLFAAAATLARYRPLERARVGIVTNGGGAGVLAVDRLLDHGGELATLSDATIAALDRELPATWSRANPVDIIGDAPPERYRAAITAVAADPQVDVLLVLNCPTAMASSLDAARAVAALTQAGHVAGKPVVAAWLGDATAAAARRHLEAAGIACHGDPGDAARSVAWLDDWSRARRMLMRVPEHTSADVEGRRADAAAIFARVAAEGRRMLTEVEAKGVLAAYGVPVPRTIVVDAGDPAGVTDATMAAARQLFSAGHAKVVVKLLSKLVSHKSDLGGVVLDLETPQAAADAARDIAARFTPARPGESPDGFAVQPMVVRKRAHELIVGVSRDRIFGPVIAFGAGGTAVEVLDDIAIGLPPLDDVLGGDLIDATRIGRLLAGWRDRPAADRTAVLHAINAVSALVVDFACIDALDVNPLLADEHGVVALDARIEIDPARVNEPAPNPDLAIRPWPADWQREHVVRPRADADMAVASGSRYPLRPIKPQDVGLYRDFFARLTPEDVRLRFLSPRKSFSDDELLRMTQLDYGREIAFVALHPDGSLVGVSRLACDPDGAEAEYAVIVRSDQQRLGLGRALMELLLDYAAAKGIGLVYGHVLAENDSMLGMCRALGFNVAIESSEPGVRIVTRALSTPSSPVPPIEVPSPGVGSPPTSMVGP